MSTADAIARGIARSCRSKRCFENERAAHAAIQAEQWHTLDEGVTLRAYKCPRCPGWHLTSVRLGSSRHRKLARPSRKEGCGT